MVINVSINWIWGFWKGAGISKEHFSWLYPADMAALQWDSGGENDPAAVRLESRENRVSGVPWSQAKLNKDFFIAIKKIIWLTLHNEKDEKTVCMSP